MLTRYLGALGLAGLASVAGCSGADSGDLFGHPPASDSGAGGASGASASSGGVTGGFSGASNSGGVPGNGGTSAGGTSADGGATGDRDASTDGGIGGSRDLDAASDADATASGGVTASSGGVTASSGGTGSTCAPPVGGDLFVAPGGDDATGTGSASCPFATITHALSLTAAAPPGAATRWTINLEAGSSAAPVIYGNGCTAGAGKCDATRIRIGDAMSHGIVIQGLSADPTATVVAGGSAGSDNEVFLVNAPRVGFENLTIRPGRVRTTGAAGSAGIRFSAPAAAGAEAQVTNVVVLGITKSIVSEPTGPGIEISGGTSPAVGPGVTITGGTYSVLVTQANAGSPAVASAPTLASSTLAPSVFRAGELACVRVESTNASATAMPSATVQGTSPNQLHLTDCGGSGGIVVDTVKAGPAVSVSDVLIDATITLPPQPPPPANFGIRLLHAAQATVGTGVTITHLTEVVAAATGTAAGIEAAGTSVLTIAGTPISAPDQVPTVLVTANGVNGVHVTGGATATITGLASTHNSSSGATQPNGLLCDGTGGGGAAHLSLRASLFLANEGQGAAVRSTGAGCVADLGSNASAGANIFNTTADRNGHLGLCYQSTVTATASGSFWACGLASGAACTAATGTGTTTVDEVAGCDLVGDYNKQPASGGLTVSLPAICCGK